MRKFIITTALGMALATGVQAQSFGDEIQMHSDNAAEATLDEICVGLLGVITDHTFWNRLFEGHERETAKYLYVKYVGFLEEERVDYTRNEIEESNERVESSAWLAEEVSDNGFEDPYGVVQTVIPTYDKCRGM